MTPTQSVCLSPSAFEQGNTRAKATPISKVISCQEKGKGRRGRENQILICTNNQSPSTRRVFERREIQLQALPSRGAGLKSRPAGSRGRLLRASLLQLSTSKADHLGEHSEQKQLLKMHMKRIHSYLSLQLDNLYASSPKILMFYLSEAIFMHLSALSASPSFHTLHTGRAWNII